MDLTELLELIRTQASEVYMCGQNQTEVDGLQAICLATNLISLDTCLTEGVALPDQWVDVVHSVGKPRRQYDGVVLEDATHGTRGGYNKGCRCLECTKANRIGHATYIRSARKASAKEASNGNV